MRHLTTELLGTLRRHLMIGPRSGRAARRAGIGVAFAAALLTACAIEEPTAGPTPDEATGEISQASTFAACEDQCSECGDLRCPSETRYLCLHGGDGHGHSCPPPGFPTRTLACVCCAPNEHLVGSHQTGVCQPCPAGQLWDEGNNRCCTPKTEAQACGTRECGTVSNGCGGTITCGTCSFPQTCQSGQCVGETCTTGSCRPCGGNQVQICNANHTWNACHTGACP